MNCASGSTLLHIFISLFFLNTVTVLNLLTYWICQQNVLSKIQLIDAKRFDMGWVDMNTYSGRVQSVLRAALKYVYNLFHSFPVCTVCQLNSIPQVNILRNVSCLGYIIKTHKIKLHMVYFLRHMPGNGCLGCVIWVSEGKVVVRWIRLCIIHCNPSTGTAFQGLFMGLRCPLDENRGNCRPAGKDGAASNSFTFRHSQRKMLYLGTDMKPRLFAAVIPTDTCEFFIWNTASSLKELLCRHTGPTCVSAEKQGDLQI